jgi:membrane-associated HD superfamily phosphohydrolase
MNILSTDLGVIFGFNIFDRFQEGGTTGMTLVLICFLIVIFFAIKAFNSLKGSEAVFQKNKKLINHAAILGLVISLMNSLMGLIGAFDAIEAAGDISPSLLAGGLKITLLSPLFGLLVLICGFTASFILTVMRRAEVES